MGRSGSEVFSSTLHFQKAVEISNLDVLCAIMLGATC
jgi:hypothetical protein